MPHETPPPNSTSSPTRQGLLGALGPGVVTGASDDDPSGIATYSQIGAQFGLGLIWTVLLTLPLMTAIQEICGRLGRVTGQGLAANLKQHTSRRLLFIIISLVVIANIINIAADIMALGAATALILPGSPHIYSLILTIVSLMLQIFIPYHRYVFILKWLTLSLLSYVLTIFVVEANWQQVLVATFIPEFELSSAYLSGIVAILGTTISPYLFFWQASEEVEEEEVDPQQHPLLKAPQEAPIALTKLRFDTLMGMTSASIVFFCVVLTTASTLFPAGIHNIESAHDAALALRPLAGDAAFLLFALGIIGTGLLAIPVLSASAAYAVAESFNFDFGLEKKPKEAPAFYGLIAIFTCLGLILSLININPIKALYWSAIINGIAAGPIMIAIMLVTQNRACMGDFVINGGLRVLGWLGAAVMCLASLCMICSV